jgi:hypothetical protein
MRLISTGGNYVESETINWYEDGSSEASIGGGAQLPVLCAKKPKKHGCAQRGQNPLVENISPMPMHNIAHSEDTNSKL